MAADDGERISPILGENMWSEGGRKMNRDEMKGLNFYLRNASEISVNFIGGEGA